MKIEKYILENGLKLIVQPDRSSPLLAMNLIYDVGARDEDPEMTGFAHLFEHLMFGGSVNIQDFDKPLQDAGGENNAFTNNDFTNFHLSLPAQNIETGFWLESDRMLGLNFSDSGLAVQQKVVIEEFKQRYFNQPYGDAWLHLRPMAYKIHPYQWSTIGKEISHIEKVGLKEVKEFFYRHFAPNNAILSLCGNISPGLALNLAEKWFGSIEEREIPIRKLAIEPVQIKEERLVLSRQVPADCIYFAFHMPGRLSDNFYTIDLISDLLAGGRSSRLYQVLVKEKELFSSVDAYITGDIDPGLFVVTGKPLPGINLEKAEEELWKELYALSKTAVPSSELIKVQNLFEANFIFGQTSILNKAMNLGYFEWLQSAEMIEQEVSKFRRVGIESIMNEARILFRRENCSTLIYQSEMTDNAYRQK